MPVGINYNPQDKIEIWTYDNYPYNIDKFEYICTK